VLALAVLIVFFALLTLADVLPGQGSAPRTAGGRRMEA